MGLILKHGTIVELGSPSIARSDLKIEGNQIVARADSLMPQAADEEIDLAGKLVMPGLVCAHTHLYSTLARGMPAPLRSPANFREILELIWWRLDRALDPETIFYSALVGAIEAARAGTTCLFDHHSSPSLIKGSVNIVRQALEAV